MVLLSVMARLATMVPGNELAIPDMQGNRRTSSGCSLRIADVASLPMRTGRPHDTHSQGYIVAAMLVAANAGMMQSVWRKGGETSIGPP
jgi:hypothetical protein